MVSRQFAGVSFEKIAFELYGLPLDEFVSVRDERAAAARKQKDRELANALKVLAKPTVGAWAVNQLVRRETRLVEQLLQVGDGLRAAQLHLDGERLRELSTERRRLLAKITAEIRRLGVSEAAEQEAVETLGAAVAEASVAAEVRAGCVTRVLQHSGFGGLEGMLAAGLNAAQTRPAESDRDPGPGVAPKPEHEPEPEPEKPEPEPEKPEPEPEKPEPGKPEPEPEKPEPEPEKPEPEQQVARHHAKVLSHRLERADEALQEACSDRDLARERVDSLRERLQAAKEKLKTAEQAVRSAQTERDEIQEQLDEL